MRRTLFFLAALGLAGYIIGLNRALQAAKLRGDMYRDIASRLDQRVVELGGTH